MVNYSAETLDAVFSALADPTRRSILEQLALGESTVSDLAEPFAVSLPAISKHLRVLENAGLLLRARDGRIHRCNLSTEPLKEAAEWIARYRRFWEERFHALADYLNETQKKEATSWQKKARIHKRRSSSSEPSQPRARKSSRPGPTRRR